jgi:UDP-N-acetylglucosamine--N-acetylmuramyl-(pentapeptide) pyrophosphoryl-undecaprenol N-acetylglucosamine transferase
VVVPVCLFLRLGFPIPPPVLLVVTRAGATTILELAALARPTILIPNGKLTGGHQLKNAAVYLEKNAVKVVDENSMIKDHQLLVSSVKDILDNQVKASKMAQSLSNFARPNAARDVADMIISSAK